MASKSTINKRVNIYINGREVSNDIKSIRTEMQKAVNDIARMKRGSDEYNAKAKEIRTLKARNTTSNSGQRSNGGLL